MSSELFTIGHSTHSLDDFLGLLAQHSIECLIDIRRFPGSHRHPHFSKDNLAKSLQAAGIEYHWLEVLGGRRGKETTDSSLNLGLRNESFRNYADYMLTEEFRAGVKQLLEVASRKLTAFMCSEGLFWRCHRRLVSDFLLAKGISIQHIMPGGKLQPHALTKGAKISGEMVTYPPPGADQARLLFD